MAAYIEMPKLSDTMTEGRVVKWRKKTGDPIEIGDILAEIETDKAVMDMEAFDEGVLGKILVPEGESAKIGQNLAVLSNGKGDAEPAEGKETGTPAVAETRKKTEEPDKTKEPSRKSPPRAEAPPAPELTSPRAEAGQRLKASPLARKMATEKNVELSEIAGSGPGGRIIARDVQDRAGAASKAQGAATAPAQSTRKIPLSGVRKIIADRLLASKTQIPHFYLHVEVDVAELLQVRSMLNKAAEQNQIGKITINDFIIKAVAMAAVRVPQVNASFAGSEIIEYASVDLAVAVAIDEGLITPVVRHAEKRSLRETSETIKDLAERARSRKLKPEEFQGGTITVSNLGSYGVERFAAIINPPQALIVSVGAVVKKPVVNAQNQIVPGERMDIGISADHRVVDGAIGAKFLAELRKILETPALILL
ncbi:MAG TPA: pyruvate dehydrogenase complex dihydrolipoamide acetyltransferase [Verrucomicrobiae bacterium]|nr:pyruvate dehydrogenase complex dihydrolipoamide acetyltransferase [Verrucomicrobiae bacterium]